MTTKAQIMSGVCDDGNAYVPGVSCLRCGKFVGRDGYIGIEHFEMSNEIASVEGECARCLSAESTPKED